MVKVQPISLKLRNLFYDLVSSTIDELSFEDKDLNSLLDEFFNVQHSDNIAMNALVLDTSLSSQIKNGGCHFIFGTANSGKTWTLNAIYEAIYSKSKMSYVCSVNEHGSGAAAQFFHELLEDRMRSIAKEHIRITHLIDLARLTTDNIYETVRSLLLSNAMDAFLSALGFSEKQIKRLARIKEGNSQIHYIRLPFELDEITGTLYLSANSEAAFLREVSQLSDNNFNMEILDGFYVFNKQSVDEDFNTNDFKLLDSVGDYSLRYLKFKQVDQPIAYIIPPCYKKLLEEHKIKYFDELKQLLRETYALVDKNGNPTHAIDIPSEALRQCRDLTKSNIYKMVKVTRQSDTDLIRLMSDQVGVSDLAHVLSIYLCQLSCSCYTPFKFDSIKNGPIFVYNSTSLVPTLVSDSREKDSDKFLKTIMTRTTAHQRDVVKSVQLLFKNIEAEEAVTNFFSDHLVTLDNGLKHLDSLLHNLILNNGNFSGHTLIVDSLKFMFNSNLGQLSRYPAIMFLSQTEGVTDAVSYRIFLTNGLKDTLTGQQSSAARRYGLTKEQSNFIINLIDLVRRCGVIMISNVNPDVIDDQSLAAVINLFLSRGRSTNVLIKLKDENGATLLTSVNIAEFLQTYTYADLVSLLNADIKSSTSGQPFLIHDSKEDNTIAKPKLVLGSIHINKNKTDSNQWFYTARSFA